MTLLDDKALREAYYHIAGLCIYAEWKKGDKCNHTPGDGLDEGIVDKFVALVKEQQRAYGEAIKLKVSTHIEKLEGRELERADFTSYSDAVLVEGRACSIIYGVINELNTASEGK